MTAVAVAVALDDARRLSATATYHGHSVALECAGASELTARLRSTGVDVALVAATPQYLDAALIAECDRGGVRLVVFAPDAAGRRLATSLGILETVDGPPGWEALDAEPMSVRPGELPSESAKRSVTVPGSAQRGRGRVVAVWGPGGAPGRSSIALALAAELADLGVSVTLADADSHAASIAPMLGMLDEVPGFAAACRLAGSGSLTREEFERIAEMHRTRGGAFRVLTGLGRPSRWPELTSSRVEATLRALRDWNEVVVVDVAASLESDEELSSDLAAPRRNAATISVIAEADAVIAVGSADPVGLARFIRAHAELLELVDPSRVSVVVNRLRSGAIGLSPTAQVRQTLLRFGGIENPEFIPYDRAAFDAAALSARTLTEVAPRSPARAAVQRIAEQLAPPVAQERRPAPRRLGRSRPRQARAAHA